MKYGTGPVAGELLPEQVHDQDGVHPGGNKEGEGEHNETGPIT